MSAILGVFGSRGPLTNASLSGIVSAMAARGADHVDVWRDEGVVLAVSRHQWELAPGFSGPAMIAHDDGLVVAADATLYYRDDLRGKLAQRGVTPSSGHPGHLIAAAYRAWGEACVDHIEGDFAFIVWDRAARRAVCARDCGGKRPLHYADLGGELVVASTISGVVAHPRCPEDLNVPLLGATAAGMLWSAGPETCYTAVRVFPNAHRMGWQGGHIAGPVRYWEAPVGAGSGAALTHAEAADALRDALATACLQRLRPGETNTVWMSGGWDSTAVFAAAQEGVRLRGDSTSVLPVSISYPEGDPGREDDLITAVADRWNVPVHWLDIADIPFLDHEAERSARRDQPYAHLYEKWNGALASGSRACGSRIALDGNGGDQLFQNSDVYLADLFRGGQWGTLRREWQARPRGGLRDFFRTVLQPNLPSPVMDFARQVRGGRPLRHYLEREMPGWVEPGFAARHELAARDHEYLGRPIGGTHAEREIDWQFTCLFIARAFGLLGEFALEKGVELRSPLSDRRVIELALSRPWWERSSGRETKTLLRSAMRGLLPDSVLAPRAQRTGITSGYSHGGMTRLFPRLLEQTLATPLVLEELGIVRAEALRAASAAYRRPADAYTRVNLFYTLQTELWLRARVRRDTVSSFPKSDLTGGMLAGAVA